MFTKPCPGQFAEVVHQFYRDNPAQALQEEFACTLCGQSVGMTVKSGKCIPASHWPNVPKRTELNRVPGRYPRRVEQTS